MSGFGSTLNKARDGVAGLEGKVAEIRSRIQSIGDTPGGAGQWYTIREGDWIMSLAHRFGLPNWQKIWNDPQNAELRAKRIHPNILQPGDLVFIPPIVRKIDSGATEMRHRFRKPKPRAMIRLVIEDGQKKPLAGAIYVLKIKDQIIRGVTDESGKIEHEVPFDAGRCELRFNGQKPDTIRFLQPGLVAPQLGGDFNTLRAVYKAPLDPEFTAALRLKARKLVVGIGNILRGEIDGVVKKGTGLVGYCQQHADTILDQVAEAEAQARQLVDRATGGFKGGIAGSADRAHRLVEQARGRLGEANSLAKALETQARRMADQAADTATKSLADYADRANELTAGFEQKVDAAMQKMIAAEIEARHKIGAAADRARQGVDQSVATGQGLAQGLESKVQESIQEAQHRYDQAVQQGVQTSKSIVHDAATMARQHLEQQIDRNVDRAVHWLHRQVAVTQEEAKKLVGAGADQVRDAYGQVRREVDQSLDGMEAKTQTMWGEFGRLANEAVDELGAKAKRLARKMGIPADSAIDSLMREGHKMVKEAETKGSEIIGQGRQMADAKLDEADQQVEQEISRAEERINTEIDNEVARAYAEIDSGGQMVKDAAKREVGARIDEGAAAVKGRIDQAATAAHRMGQTVAQKASESASKASQSAQRGLQQAGTQVKSGISSAERTAMDAVGHVSEARELAGTRIQGTIEAVKGGVAQAEQSGEEGIESARVAVQDGIAKIDEMRTELAARAGESLSRADQVIDTAADRATQETETASARAHGAIDQLAAEREEMASRIAATAEAGKAGLREAGEKAKDQVVAAEKLAFDKIDTVFGDGEQLRRVIPDIDEMLEEIPLQIGWLDPANETSGVVGRLNNLGFDAGPPAVFMGQYARDAIRKFQYSENLPVTGQVDGATLGRLIQRHGS